ncbi:MAG: ferritin-like domain-containing protein, partial [Polyangiaceae bacterium]
PCGIPAGASPRDNCYFTPDSCSVLCGAAYFTCTAFGGNCGTDGAVVVPEEAGLVVECGICPNGTGRRPDGLRGRRPSRRKSVARDRIGEYFERATHLEDASVHAFRILHEELVAHEAPKDLIFAAKRAQADEVRHARVTRKLARVHGGSPERARVETRPIRSLEEIAIENAVEGCIRETYGALVAMWQANAAADPSIARAMEEIATDETRHAALSWSIASWIDARLDAAARSRVAAKRRRAVDELRREIAVPVDLVLVRDAGLPGPCIQEKMWSELERVLDLHA